LNQSGGSLVLKKEGDTVNTKVLLVDDDERGFLDGGIEVLSHKGFDVIAETNGDHVLERIHKDRPQVVVLDIKLPSGDQEGLTKGLSICSNIKEQQKQGIIDPALRIILVTGEYVEDSGQMLGLRLGAHAYLSKPIAFDLLAAHINSQVEESNNIKKILKNSDTSPPSTPPLVFSGITIDPSKREVTVDEKSSFSPPRRLFDILYFLATHADEAKTKREIFEEVWGYADVDESNLVTSIRDLRTCLDDKNKRRFIKTRPRYGYIFVRPKEEDNGHN